jgi:hypothetical protein
MAISARHQMLGAALAPRQQCGTARRFAAIHRQPSRATGLAAIKAAEPGKTTLGFVGIGIMGLAMVRP